MPVPTLRTRVRNARRERDEQRERERLLDDTGAGLASASILLVLRRMRAPLIVLILIFAISVLGLTLVPGNDLEGRPRHLSIFEAFYFMSYTATTIGFGEIPHAFTPAQRMWVTFSIFLSVVGWAYAIGSLLALIQDQAFRRALDRQLFRRKVAHLGEPFVLLVGYGHAARRLARALDDMGRRFVVVDRDEDRVAAIELDAYRADTPALLGDARQTGNLALAGLVHRHCEGVIAVSNDDETNLDVTMTAALLRPGLPVFSRATSAEVAERMRAFGVQEVVNPLDRFGDHLRILLRSPASYQLMMWLTSAPGTPLPERRPPLPRGRWVVCGAGLVARELTTDLQAEGVDVTTLVGERGHGAGERYGAEAVVAAAADAAVFVAATDDDMTNLWLLQTVREGDADTYLVAMQNRPGNASLFDAVGVDFGLVAPDVIAHEVLARLANPALMRFLPQVPRLGGAWAEEMVDRLVERCGTDSPHLWRVDVTAESAPALAEWLAEDRLRLGDLLRSPLDRDRPLPAVALALLREGEAEPAPGDEQLLREGDRLLLAGRASAQRQLDLTLTHRPTAAQVLDGRFVPSSWVWRVLTGRR